MIHFYRLDDDSSEYEKFGQMTDGREIIEGEETLLSIYPQERWEEATPEEILASFNNGPVTASHENPKKVGSDSATP